MKIPNKIIECEICTKLALFRLQQVCIAIRFAGALAATTNGSI